MNLPNKLSIFRICLVPVFFIVIYSDIDHAVEFATFIFIIGAFTDFVDGFIARRTGTITDFGRFIDPLADKILVVSALIYLVSVESVARLGENIIPVWMVVIIVGRDFTVSGIRMMSAGKGKVISASKLGKLKTNSQIAAVVLCLLQYRPDVMFLDQPYYWWLMLVAVILTLISGADYVWKNRKLIKDY